ncbi:MAG TPA: two-component system response regulator [Lachnospiraceae bacterium]|nr:two-component system response regulator [Lachnospiraceae bacterium]
MFDAEVPGRCGHTVLEARNGQECLDILQSETVDVCVLDIVMPVMDGIVAALQRIKEGHPGVRTIMISALSRESCVKQAWQLGADAFVVKPFQEQCLIERIG